MLTMAPMRVIQIPAWLSEPALLLDLVFPNTAILVNSFYQLAEDERRQGGNSAQPQTATSRVNVKFA
jgi:hypothetical protein